MTKNYFENTLNVYGGQFTFFTNQYEGMIGVSPSRVVIWVDDKGFGELNGDDEDLEPRNIGVFESVNELLLKFKVDGKPFIEFLLPDIKELNQIYT